MWNEFNNRISPNQAENYSVPISNKINAKAEISNQTARAQQYFETLKNGLKKNFRLFRRMKKI